ncbi:Phospholipid-transporting ATPase [Aphelenchoides fujianensis]|nr:Phospholipid-transporting ATPase [Aphelenchoides fujianensis]
MRFFQSVHEWFCGPTELGKRLVTIGEANMRLAGNRISTTKYTVLTFLPKFLVEQFSNVVNVFFLILACAQVVPYFEPPYGRATTIAPLRRKLSDRKINRTVARVFDKQRGWHNCFWCKIRVGQIVKVMNGEKIPADLVLLSSSEPGGMAYIETSNLDGESNLKIRQALTTTSKLINDEMILTLLDRRAFIHCDLPNCLIYEFQGTMHLTRDPCPSSSRQHSGSTARSVRQTPLSASTPLTPHEMLVFPLSTGHLMPRGARLMNTETAYGVVIYAGKHTKLMMNQTRTPAKSSIVNQMTNYVMMVHFGVLMVMSATATALSLWHSYKNRFNEWYLPLQQDQQFTKSRGPAMKIFFTELMLFSRIIPISLLVTLEFIRLIQAWLIENDLEMYDERTDSRAVVRRSELNDMLGQMCSIGARRYGSPASEHFDNQLLLTDLHLGVKEKPLIWDFLLISAVCHTVIPEKHHSEKSSAETVEYNASSPDEAALVRFARDAGVVFHTRTPEYVLVDMVSARWSAFIQAEWAVQFGKTHRFEVLNVLEFTSDRKRMGVIVRTEEGKLRLFVKGADCVVLPRVRRNNPEVFAATLKNLDDFARLGYRTLCLASRELGAEEYAKAFKKRSGVFWTPE